MSFKNSLSKGKKEELKYKILKKFGQLDSDSKMPKELRLISWNGANPKYDLRPWGVNEDGSEKCGKGITLDAEELQSLFELLQTINED